MASSASLLMRPPCYGVGDAMVTCRLVPIFASSRTRWSARGRGAAMPRAEGGLHRGSRRDPVLRQLRISPSPRQQMRSHPRPHLCRTYEKTCAPVSNSYARAATLQASSQCSRVTALVTLTQMSHAIAERLKRAMSLLSALQQAAARTRADRARVEAELFRGRYHLSSKNDDDLPLVR